MLFIEKKFPPDRAVNSFSRDLLKHASFQREYGRSSAYYCRLQQTTKDYSHTKSNFELKYQLKTFFHRLIIDEKDIINFELNVLIEMPKIPTKHSGICRLRRLLQYWRAALVVTLLRYLLFEKFPQDLQAFARHLFVLHVPHDRDRIPGDHRHEHRLLPLRTQVSSISTQRVQLTAKSIYFFVENQPVDPCRRKH